ncbi:hypothetical protein NDU88_006668 [Pleurodeles waltl]|uniref:Reverse transcriptase RNase H-like domain-containing protein n=1 Tax=Pleurodeles waltl TaxID=8319 RepID=A0AAV7RQW4_PLEWA|nr:hypothetical protein NDU88_006668 [Pleurodeles waltl]
MGPTCLCWQSLDPTEQQYAQIERETLVIKWPCGHFHPYLCGRPFRVITDHQPLLKGTAPHTPQRTERKVTFLEPQYKEPEPVYPRHVPSSEGQKPLDVRDKEPTSELGAPSTPEATQFETQDEGR